ncbi:MAG: hypothetical protein GF315_02585 [candidate division Zixibacteria bacterium]|nr:hypothetical protein [candidate division Zixibacteria bacterium]
MSRTGNDEANLNPNNSHLPKDAVEHVDQCLSLVMHYEEVERIAEKVKMILTEKEQYSE